MSVSLKSEETKNRLIEVLAELNLKQREAARLAGVKNDVIQKGVHRGSVPRHQETREAVARALGVNPAWLWFGEGTKKPDNGVHVKESLGATIPMRIDEDGYIFTIKNDDTCANFKAVVGDQLYITPSIPPRPEDKVLVVMLTGEVRMDVLTTSPYQNVVGFEFAGEINLSGISKIQKIGALLYR